MPDITTQATVDGIAHALAAGIVESLKDIAANLTPEALQRAAESRAVSEGYPTPSEGAQIALMACLDALETIRRQMPPAPSESEGGEA